MASLWPISLKLLFALYILKYLKDMKLPLFIYFDSAKQEKCLSIYTYIINKVIVQWTELLYI